MIARFKASGSMAMMDHPNIAQSPRCWNDGTGCPYFVMELVCGVPITEYCDENRLSTVTERLNLFVQVCRADAARHQKGIIHRDIKPSQTSS